MKCKYCGKQLDDGSTYCPRCGKSLGEPVDLQPPPPPVEERYCPYDEDTSSGRPRVYWRIGFFIPTVGLFLYLIWKNKKPRTARACLQGFLVCLVIGVVLLALCLLIMCSQEPDPPQYIPPFLQ